MKERQIGNNLLPAIAYGDACGLPYEGKLPAKIGDIHELPKMYHNEFLDILDALKGKKGLWSDDTHLSCATAHSLIRTGGFSIDDIAAVHVEALDHVHGGVDNDVLIPAIVTKQRNNGFGKSTIRSIERLQNGARYDTSGEPNGSGNGVLMKLAPLVYWQYFNQESADVSEDQIEKFTRLTHDSGAAVVSSLVHRFVLMQLISMDPHDQEHVSYVPRLYDDAIYVAKSYESVYDAAGSTSHALEQLEPYLEVGNPVTLSKNVILSKVKGSKGGGFYAPEALMMAYGSFLLEQRFPECVYRAVELGGDTDSVGSIVAAMSANYWGDLDFPDDAEEICAIDRIRRLSRSLAQVTLGDVTAHGNA